MAEAALLPTVRTADADTLLVADGTSCRHQIADGAQRAGRARRAGAGAGARLAARAWASRAPRRRWRLRRSPSSARWSTASPVSARRWSPFRWRPSSCRCRSRWRCSRGGFRQRACASACRTRATRVVGEIARMVPLMIVGTVTGTTAAREPAARRLAGRARHVCPRLRALQPVAACEPRRRSARAGRIFAGFCGGLSGTLFGAGGPPYAIYLSHRPLEQGAVPRHHHPHHDLQHRLRIVAFW